MRTIHVKSPSNIAFVKYWGQRDADFVLPFNDSVSMNLSHCYTDVVMEILEDPAIQEMQIKEFGSSEYRPSTPIELEKVTRFYDTAKAFLNAELSFGFRIQSANSFPQKAGIASSASFFSAMALAFVKAFQTAITQEQLSVLARLSGSGSACRSIPDGFVWWNTGLDSNSSFAVSIAPPTHWDVCDVVLVVSKGEKKVSSIEGHAQATTSPLFTQRQQMLPTVLADMKDALLKKDFTRFGVRVEQEAINFHAVMMTQTPPLFYWSGSTMTCLREVVHLREQGVECYSTIDAGENIHVICLSAQVEQVRAHFAQVPEVQTIITNSAAVGAREV